ncbi:peptidase domain-containing ABC transporter [Ktedonosporobacter rubrisoli]|uniref:Peptidase domain-containing ABC transporter n=1 Tax=Ktedonosporobacter rubrisoli TaxID=2509675 RepID=A0A4P6K1N6_KTERU|nr:peptidase domain-containing ABC transporter [Ktedonosporobacter rubrisoli]QBD81733.1 peptidase domain-containing ABC transporter [Ktedonosporobacter rubrisoli]
MMKEYVQSYPQGQLAQPVNKRGSEQIIYSGTADARRLEKQRRIAEKKLGWKDVRQFSQFITPFKWQIILALLLTVGTGLMALPMPFIFRTLIDDVFHRHDVRLFFWSLLLFLAILLLEEILRFFTRNVIGVLSRSVNLNITYRFYHHMLRLPLSFYQNLSSTGQILSRLNEVTSVQQTAIQIVIDAAVNCILTVIYVGVLFTTDWRLSLVVLAITPTYLGVNLYFNRHSRLLSRQVMESYAITNGAMYEGLTGLKTVKALAAEPFFSRYIRQLIIKTNNLSLRRTTFQAQANMAIGTVQALGIITLLSVGGYLVLNGNMTAGQLAAFVLILRELASPLSTLAGINQQMQAAAVAVDRLFEILNAPEEGHRSLGYQLAMLEGHIRMRHVHFSYTPGVEVLHDINLDVPAGTTIALVGRSGAGKTTLANLLLGFYQPEKGHIMLDGCDLRHIKLETLRSQFGVILQDDALFSGTIEDNLTFGLGRSVSQEELVEAARNANILEFIQDQPLGFKTLIRERGQSLSGGQRQRIAIARMFLRQPRILLMDEPSSALDNESEALIQQALKRLAQGRTTFIIAHRLSTIRNADRIVIIDNGSIVEMGTHKELVARRGIYWQLYNSYGRV